MKTGKTERPAVTRRDLLRTGLGLSGMSTAAFTASARASAQGGGAAPVVPQPVEGTRLVLLGTQGGPNINLRRGQAASAVVVDGRPYVVDCGYGTLRSLVAAGIPFTQVSTLFITHLHDDHTSDIAALVALQWTGGRTQPANVYGPFGTAGLIEAAVAFSKANVEIRVTDEGRTVRPEQLFRGHDVAAEAQPVQVFKDDRLTVTAIENAHYPDRARAAMRHRSLAYRLQTATRSIVFSGDTAYSKNLVTLAKGADLFVCEIIDQTQYDANLAAAQAQIAAGNRNSVPQHIIETHVNNAEVGRMATEAGVGMVVLTHLVPGGNGPGPAEFPDSRYIDGVRKTFQGQVIVGRDLMVL